MSVIFYSKFITKRIIAISCFSLFISSNSWGGVESEYPELLPKKVDNYTDINLPEHFQTSIMQSMDSTPDNNPTTNHGATLGRVLFYDKKLSSDNSTSCGSCHIQKHGFSDIRPVSPGVNGLTNTLKTPPLDNLRWRSQFQVTGDEFTLGLETQSLLAITNPSEMGRNNVFEAILAIEEQPYYADLFKKAFGDARITENRIAKALSQFMRSMVSFNSKFDKGVAVNFANFTEEENQGRLLFDSDRTNCSECHDPLRLHQNLQKESIGINPQITMSIGSLRNVNNRKFFTLFSSDTRETLKDMLIHYNRNISRCVDGALLPVPDENGEIFPFGSFDCPTLAHHDPDPGQGLLRDENDNGKKMMLSEEEEDAIISYLKTLSDPIEDTSIDENGNVTFYNIDHSLLADPKFSDPFFKKNIPNIENAKKIIAVPLFLLED